MLDKTSKKVLKYLSTCDDKSHYYFDPFPDELGDDDEIIFAAIRYLDKRELVEIIHTNNGISAGFRLSHEGLHSREISFINFIDYVKDKWIDVLALIISVAAFIGAYRTELASIIRVITK